MSEQVNVTALRGHGNGFGAAYRKQVGDGYACPASIAAKLAAQGLVKVDGDESELQLHGRQGTGKGAGRAGKGSNAENGGPQGLESSS